MRYFCSKDCFDICEFDITGSPDNPDFTPVKRPYDHTPFVCSKLHWWYDREVRTPRPASFARIEGRSVSIPDDQALSAAARLIDDARGKPILVVRGTGSLGYSMKYWKTLLSAMDNTEFVGSGGVCDGIACEAHEADFGVVTNPPMNDMENARTIILFGKNAKVTNPHLYAHLKRLKKAGATIISIDPVRSETTGIADTYIRIAPSTDGHLAAALLAHRGLKGGINESAALAGTGIDHQTFEKLSRCFDDGPVAIIAGVGMSRYKNGKNSVRWLNRLAVATGNIERYYFGKGSTDMFVSPPSQPRPEVSIHEAARKLTEGYYAAAIVIAGNPVMSYPDSARWQAGLGRVPLVVVDPVITRTARLADVFVRVGGMFAQDDAMGSFFFPDVSATRKRFITKGLSDTDAAKAMADLLGIPLDIPPMDNIPRATVPTRSFTDRVVPLTPPMKSPTGTLRLISGSNPHWINSQVAPECPHGDSVTLSFEAADARGITDGDIVRLSGAAGSATARATVSDMVDGETAHVYKSRDLMSGWSNSVVRSVPADGSEHGIGIYDTFVTVERIAD